MAVTSNKKLDELTSKLIAALWNKEETIGTEGMLITAEALELLKGLKSGYGVTTGYNTPDTLAYQLMEYNLFEFSASKTEARLAAMNDLLFDQDKNQIRPYAEFEQLASEQVASFNREWLQTEYNLSIAVGQNSAAYNRFKAEEKDFPYVEYQTVGDSSVRAEHEKLNGMIFNLNDREAMQLWPPNGYNCRCEMLQTNKKPKNITSGKLAQEMLNADDAKWSKSQFNINRGDLKEIFTKPQFYTKNKGLPEKLNQMTFDKYGLDTAKSLQKKASKINIDKTITKDNVKELFKKSQNENFMRFEDYLKRKITMSSSTFKSHRTKQKYVDEKRYELFPLIKPILNDPDEVWMNIHNKRGFQTSYIKHYNDRSVIIITSMNLEKTTLEIETWFEIDLNNKSLERRKGLKIK